MTPEDREDRDLGEGKGKGKGGGKKGGKGKDRYDSFGGGSYGKGGGGGGGGSNNDPSSYSGEFQTGTVAKFLTDRGFGYISPDDGGSDIFVHFSAIQGSGYRELAEGQRVSFGAEFDPKGKGK